MARRDGKKRRFEPEAKPSAPQGPLYETVKRRVSERILLGEWPPGKVIPGEQKLALEFAVAVGTIRRALADLVQEGMLARRRKTGTVVTGRTPQHSLRLFFQYFRLHGVDGSLQRSRVREPRAVVVPAEAVTAAKLGIRPGDPLIDLRRVRWAAGRPVMLDRYLIPRARVPDFPLSPALLPALLFRRLLDAYGIRISAVREELRAEPATADDARRLRLVRPAAVLVIDAVAFDQSGKPCVVSERRATTARHRYINEIM
jgi:GntR family transcriptional regulator